MTEAPIFIVGVARSGTTLLAAMLAAHSELSCGPETHFFRFLSKVALEKLVDPKTWPQPAVNFIESISLNTFSSNGSKTILEKYKLDESQVSLYLNAHEPSITAILSSVTEQYMTLMGKHQWVEKTPDHIKHLDLIRKYFTNSLIIRIVRDPRDVALSLTKVPWGAMTLLEAFLYWKKMDDASREFFARDENSYTLRYEDLILSPQETLQQLCERIGVEYEATMLNTSQTGKMVNSANVAWKSKVSQPIDHNRISVWRNELTEEQNRLAEALLGDRIKSYQYPLVCDLDQFGEIFPTSLLTSKYGELQNLVNISKVRFWKVYPDEKPKVRVYLGDPGSKEWKENRGKTKNFFKLIADFILSVLSRNKMFWLPDPDAFGWSGYGAYIIKHLLRPYLLKVN